MKCGIEGCNNTTAGESGAGRGLCRAHYKRWYKYGDVNEPVRRVKSWSGEQCAVGCCTNQVRRNGLCDKHAAAQKRLDNPNNVVLISSRIKRRLLAKREALMGRPRPECCELCGSRGYGRAGHKNAGICFDHNHATGKPRGWLCDRCNKVLGLVKDEISLLIKMCEYLERPNDEARRRSA